jgi:hypothetical protein
LATAEEQERGMEITAATTSARMQAGPALITLFSVVIRSLENWFAPVLDSPRY